MSYEKATIMAVLNRIHSGDLILPDIQRDFVWGTDRIYKLLDSILRSYPFGTLLFWNTKLRVQYREFIKDWADDRAYTFRIKEAGQPRTLVLDGQQRLQSLYIAVFGSYEQQMLYFDLLSGGHQQDVSELRFVCEFMSPARCDELNRNSGGQVYWVPLRDIVMIPDWSLLGVRTEDYQTKAGIAAASPEGIRLNSNLQTLFHTFRTGEVLNYFTQDKDCEGGKQPTPLDEILEIFVRVNSGGQVLSKSDLMFSLLQLHWPDAAAEIADLIDELNSKGRFEFDKDFVLKCALVCCGRGARYDVAKLRDDTTLTEIKTAFPKITNALINCVDFVVGTAKFRDGRILGSYNALIPFVYFYYLQPSQQVRQEAALVAMNQVLYLALMTSAFSRYSDNRVDHVVERILKPAQAAQPGVFPLGALCAYIDAQEHHGHIDNALLQRNVPLLMNILEGGSLLPEGRRHYRPEFDHIFPKSKLSRHGYSETQIGDFANFRLISKQRNIWKSNQDPKAYFSQQDGLMQYYLIPPEYLDYDQFPTFLEERRKLIWAQVCRFLGMGDGPSQPGGADDRTAPAKQCIARWCNGRQDT